MIAVCCGATALHITGTGIGNGNAIENGALAFYLRVRYTVVTGNHFTSRLAS
jgi:hypothetical protein